MATLKFIQVNIYRGKYLENLIEFLLSEKPDFITMQEVTAVGTNLYRDKTANLFDLLKDKLGLEAFFDNVIEYSDLKDSLFGNAVFSRYPIVAHKVITLKDFRKVTICEVDGEKAFEIRPLLARHLIDALVDLGDLKIRVIGWHGAWTAPPTDTDETLRQAKIVAEYLRFLEEPFILGGDLNAIPESTTVKMINEVAGNLMINSGVSQTTHPRLHEIVPIGYLVDYIFVSKRFKAVRVDAPLVDVSDHLPVVAVLEFPA